MAARRYRFIAIPLLVLAGVAFARGKGKVIEFLGTPKTIPAIAEALPKQKKDATKRAALSLSLDQLLREKPELTEEKVYDELFGTLMNDVLERMCEPSEVFSTDHGPDNWNPRGDVFFKDTVKVFPGRVSKAFHRKYTKKPNGKNIDRGYRGQAATLEFQTATSEDDFQAWTDTKGWGVFVHEAHIDPATGVARIGLTWVSPGSKDTPGSHIERPVWIGFYKQPKPGVGMYMPLAIESETATDWREQPVNMVPPKTEPNDLERKLRIAVWVEDVRVLPTRTAFAGNEEKIFNMDDEADEKLEAAQIPMLEPYRESMFPMVRAAVELKIASLGGNASAESVDFALKGVKHGAVKAKLEKLKASLPPPVAVEDAPKDAGK